jgi:hypothetical protein
MTSSAYSAKTVFDMFFIGRTKMLGAKELWTSGAPLKHKLHMWLVLKDRLWTLDKLAKRDLQHQTLCVMCCNEEETIENLTLYCPFSREIWYHMLQPLRMHMHTPNVDACLSICG